MKNEVKELIIRLENLKFQFDTVDTQYNPMEYFVDYVSTKEIVHSMILANLLNPDGEHQLGDSFLLHFFNKCEIYGDVNDVKVFTEYCLHDGPWDGRRIDILVRGVCNNRQVAVIIENKLNGAGYQPNQLEDYRSAIERELGDNAEIKVACLHRDKDLCCVIDGADYILYPEDIAEMIDAVIESFKTTESCYIKAYSRLLNNLHIKNRIMDNANILAGDEITGAEIKKIKALSEAIAYLPQAYAAKIVKMVESGNICGADSANINLGHDNYADLYVKSIYDKTNQWLAVGFYENEVCFYLVSNDHDTEESNRKANLAGFSPKGTKGKRGYIWYKPVSYSLDFSIPYGDCKPDFCQIKERAEKLLRNINAVSDKVK